MLMIYKCHFCLGQGRLVFCYAEDNSHYPIALLNNIRLFYLLLLFK